MTDQSNPDQMLALVERLRKAEGSDVLPTVLLGMHNAEVTCLQAADALAALLARAEKAEAERDTAWNDAIEAAATKVDQRKSILEVGTQLSDAIRALKKGEPT